jgi:hypothetical protein
MIKTTGRSRHVEPQAELACDDVCLQSLRACLLWRCFNVQGKAKNIPAGNITAAGHMASLHFLQEYGTLPKWLPQLYKNRQQAAELALQQEKWLSSFYNCAAAVGSAIQ